MPAKAFFDTSVLVYLVSDDDRRSEIAANLLKLGGVISTQTLNEFTSVMRRKFRLDWERMTKALFDVRSFCDGVLPVTLETHEEGLRISQRYGYHIYDSLMIASALEAGCTTLYAEDMQDGQVIGALTIRNPFLMS
jgi:predicted nucleic acid-binding protein